MSCESATFSLSAVNFPQPAIYMEVVIFCLYYVHHRSFTVSRNGVFVMSLSFTSRIAVMFLALGFILSTVSSAEAELIHLYNLNGNYDDLFGGPDLTAGGPDGVGAFNGGNTAYTFGPTGSSTGLSLAGALPDTSTYTLLVDAALSNVSMYNKIIDFTNLAADPGLYVSGPGNLNAYSLSAIGSTAIGADTLTRIVLTRDGAGTLTGYVDGVQQFSVNDALNNFHANVINFFNDDAQYGNSEISAGLVDRIAIYDTVLNATEVGALGGPGELAAVPEPSSFILVAGLVGGGWWKRRRSAKTAAA